MGGWSRRVGHFGVAWTARTEDSVARFTDTSCGARPSTGRDSIRSPSLRHSVSCTGMLYVVNRISPHPLRRQPRTILANLPRACSSSGRSVTRLKRGERYLQVVAGGEKPIRLLFVTWKSYLEA